VQSGGSAAPQVDVKINAASPPLFGIEQDPLDPPLRSNEKFVSCARAVQRELREANGFPTDD